MAAEELKSFLDMQNYILRELGMQASDTNSLAKIKQFINATYIHEVVPQKRWKWIQAKIDIVHIVPYETGTASVTNDNTAVTLSDAPGSALGSFADYLFSVDGFDEIYEVSSHTAAATAVVLKSKFQGATNTAVGYKIWRDRIDLPTDCRETTQIWHDRHDFNTGAEMTPVGRQELRRIEQGGNFEEGFAVYYNTGDYKDPSPGDAETESDRFRQVRIYPAIATDAYTIHVDYVQEVIALDGDTDEPVLPLEDRIVIVYGALSKAWAALARNPEEANRNLQLYANKLAFMTGDVEASFDTPRIGVNPRYIAGLRRPFRRIKFRNF